MDHIWSMDLMEETTAGSQKVSRQREIPFDQKGN